MKKNKALKVKVLVPQFTCVAQFMAAYMEYQDRVGR